MTWYHKINSTVHLASEAWYMYERDVPSINGPIKPELGANPAYCSPGQIRCFAPEWSALNYIEKEFSPRNYISIRNEILDDIKGQRTGFKNTYSEHEIMWGHWFGSTVVLRPCIRFEHAYSTPAYDNGRKQTQLSFAMDAVLKY